MAKLTILTEKLEGFLKFLAQPEQQEFKLVELAPAPELVRGQLATVLTIEAPHAIQFFILGWKFAMVEDSLKAAVRQTSTQALANLMAVLDNEIHDLHRPLGDWKQLKAKEQLLKKLSEEWDLLEQEGGQADAEV